MTVDESESGSCATTKMRKSALLARLVLDGDAGEDGRAVGGELRTFPRDSRTIYFSRVMPEHMRTSEVV